MYCSVYLCFACECAQVLAQMSSCANPGLRICNQACEHPFEKTPCTSCGLSEVRFEHIFYPSSITEQADYPCE